MPTYQYECQGCHHSFEEFQSIKAAPLKRCPTCGKSLLKRLIGTGAAVLFKGSGFYATDYRSSEYRAKAKAESSSASSGSSGESAKSDGKPGTKGSAGGKKD